uniref:NADH-ubiquinone oxidoreductase chain 4 n=1 Tax=Staphylinidae sp. BMNH 1274241 TaxID=1796568 RepID=A0A126TDM0_9COLE|nr:NADH dehydrogenase subunit 4 [Staphylinidae sp. BMNH 1274241]
MKFLMMMVFMIPLSFFKNYYLMFYSYMIMFVFFMMPMKFNYMVESIGFFMSCDLMSYLMILLSIWICSLMILASSKIFFLNNYMSVFLLMNLMLLISLYLTFSSQNLFIFYLFFEMSLIPTLILIIGWGYQPERIQAGTYLLFYTMLASLPMLLFIFYYDLNNKSLMFYFLELKIYSLFMFFMVNMVFLVKMPMYFVHLWLPKAHVEAPVSGSMILAGVMLKLGGYGMLRLMNLFMYMLNKFNYMIIIISLIGGIYVSLICVRQSDMKCLIAYSSIAHMGLVLSGIVVFNSWGFYGALSMMLAHGLCSSGLFCLANINYERLMSRSIYLNKGLINLMPSMSLWWFLLSSSNMAAPPSFNLLGEIMLINCIVSWNFYLMTLMMMISFFSAVYSLFLYSYTQHGQYYSGIYVFMGGNMREFLLLLLHWVPLNLLVFKAELFFNWI